MYIDRIYSKGETQYLVPGGNLPQYKCLVPAQNRLPYVLVEEVEGGLNNFRVFDNDISQHIRDFAMHHVFLSNIFLYVIHTLYHYIP